MNGVLNSLKEGISTLLRFLIVNAIVSRRTESASLW